MLARLIARLTYPFRPRWSGRFRIKHGERDSGWFRPGESDYLIVIPPECTGAEITVTQYGRRPEYWPDDEEAVTAPPR